MRQITIGFTEPQYTWLKKRHQETGCSIGSILRLMVTENLEGSNAE